MANAPSLLQAPAPVSRVQELELEVRRLELQVKELKNQLYGKKSERYAPDEGLKNLELFADPIAAAQETLLVVAVPREAQKSATPKGPQAVGSVAAARSR